jgi:hypothetical protein
LVFCVLGKEPRALCMIVKYSITELHSSLKAVLHNCGYSDVLRQADLFPSYALH